MTAARGGAARRPACRAAVPARVLAQVMAMLLAVASGPSAGGAPAEPQRGDSDQYTVRLDARSERLAVQACLAGAPPWRLASDSGATARFIGDIRFGRAREAPGRWRDGGITLPADGDGCVTYRVALAAARGEGRGAVVSAVGRDWITSPAYWLLTPRRDGADRPLEVAFELPAGIAVSVPWTPLGDGRYRIEAGLAGWQPIAAFGRFTVDPVEVAGTQLRVAVLDSRPTLDVAWIHAWLREVVAAVGTVHGRLPAARPQVVITPVAASGLFGARARDEAVPFARVLRDGGEALQFFVNPTADRAAMRADWTAYHEFSHLLLPFVDRGDAWISEGFASYYQNVLRARAGVIDERAAWQAMVDGFARGGGVRYTLSLRDTIAERGPNVIMRMYWSGAAVALRVDVALRRGGTGQSLDRLLGGLAGCCLPSRRTWAGRELFERLDALGGAGRLVAEYDRWIRSTGFPGVGGTMDWLGVRRGGDGQVVLDDGAPGAAVRRAIMGVGATRPVPGRTGTVPASAVDDRHNPG